MRGESFPKTRILRLKKEKKMSLNPNFKDTYVSLCGETVFINSNTRLESENPVIQKTLAPLFENFAKPSVEKICFLPLGEAERAKVKATFGDTRKETEEAYLLEVCAKQITVYSNSLRGHLWGACTLREHYRNGIAEGFCDFAHRKNLRILG